MASGVNHVDDNDVLLHSYSTACDTAELPPPGVSLLSDIEQLTVNRLPGEPLGMHCDVIDGDRGPRVMVRLVVRGSPAERATGGDRGVEVGDEILAINGVKLTNVSRVEIPQFITETPLTLILLICRQAARLERTGDCPADGQNVRGSSVMPGYALQTCKPSVMHEGFEVRQVTFHKLAADKLGLQLERRSLDLRGYHQVF